MSLETLPLSMAKPMHRSLNLIGARTDHHNSSPHNRQLMLEVMVEALVLQVVQVGEAEQVEVQVVLQEIT